MCLEDWNTGIEEKIPGRMGELSLFCNLSFKSTNHEQRHLSESVRKGNNHNVICLQVIVSSPL